MFVSFQSSLSSLERTCNIKKKLNWRERQGVRCYQLVFSWSPWQIAREKTHHGTRYLISWDNRVTSYAKRKWHLSKLCIPTCWQKFFFFFRGNLGIKLTYFKLECYNIKSGAIKLTNTLTSQSYRWSTKLAKGTNWELIHFVKNFMFSPI